MLTARLVLSSRLVRFHWVAATRPTIGYTPYFHNQQLRYFADKSFIAEAISRSVADKNKELRTADGLTAKIESYEKNLNTGVTLNTLLEGAAAVQRFVDVLSRPIREFTDRDGYLEAIKNYDGDCIATCALTKTVDGKTVPSVRAYVLPRGVA